MIQRDHTRRPRRAVPVLAALVVAAAGCGGSAPAADPPAATSPTEAALARRCTDVISADLGEGTLCVDSGFRVDSDEFSFRNWGRSAAADDNVSVQTMIDLFGHAAVCVPGPETGCVMRPRAAQRMREWNVAIANGRCEGMAALSGRMFLRYDLASDFSSRATSASDLDARNPRLARAIAYWWATQFLDEVSSVAAASRQRTPLQIVDDLIVGLANGAGQTVGMYWAGMGHSVTPFAVTRRGRDWVIHAYDNNHPGRRTEIVVAPGDDSWTYAWGAAPGGGGTADWGGGTGTLEVTPMSARGGPFACPFCAEPRAGEPTTVTVTSSDATRGVHVFLDAGEAGTLEVYGHNVTNSIDGATVTFGKALSYAPQAAASVTVSLPPGVVEAAVELRSHDTRVVTSTSTVLVRAPGLPDVQVSGAGATAAVGEMRASRPVVRLARGTLTVAAQGRTGVTVSLAGEANLVESALESDGTLVVEPVGSAREPTIEVSYKGSAGESSTTLLMSPDEPSVTSLEVKNSVLSATESSPLALRVSPASSPRSTPVPAATSTTAPSSTTTTVPTVEIALPG